MSRSRGKITWKPTPGHTYRVYRLLDNGGRKLMATTTTGSYVVPLSLTAGVWYNFVVTATNKNGESRPSNDVHLKFRR